MMVKQMVDGTTCTTSTILGKDTITLKDIEMIVEKLQKELPPISEEWILISPTGRCMFAKPEELLQVLLAYHPLLKPIGLSSFKFTG